MKRFKDSAAFVSIHAPVQGATDEDGVLTPVSSVSIHAPVQGATRPLHYISGISGFQSTLLCKERPNTL